MDWLAGRGEEYAYAFENPRVIRLAIDRAHVQPGAKKIALVIGEVKAAIVLEDEIDDPGQQAAKARRGNGLQGCFDILL